MLSEAMTLVVIRPEVTDIIEVQAFPFRNYLCMHVS